MNTKRGISGAAVLVLLLAVVSFTIFISGSHNTVSAEGGEDGDYPPFDYTPNSQEEWYDYVISAVLSAGWDLLTWKNSYADFYFYRVSIWQPASDHGDQKCHLCNDPDYFEYGCNEYQCHALGKYCDWISNEETGGAGVCVKNDSLDAIPPEISFRNNSLKPNYWASPFPANYPESPGVEIFYDPSGENHMGLLPPNRNLTVGLNTSEPAICRWDLERRPYEEMRGNTEQANFPSWDHDIFFPSSAFKNSAQYIHNFGDGVQFIDNKMEYNIYVKCADIVGNVNRGEFLVRFTIDESPDLTAPTISTSYENNIGFLKSGQEEAYLEVYTDEEADCRWEFSDVSFDSMTHDMNNSFCSRDDGDFLHPELQQLGCNVTLQEGLPSNEIRRYYIRCMDKPWLNESNNSHNLVRVSNAESTILLLVPSSPLVIDSVLLGGYGSGVDLKGASDPLELEMVVKTSGGFDEEGGATCQWSLNGEEYTWFYNNGNFGEEYVSENIHPFILYFNGGEEQKIYVRCNDKAGNIATEEFNFSISLDTIPPSIVRAYYDGESGKLKVFTNEPSVCKYSLFEGCGFAFEEGNSMEDSSNGMEHFVDWTTESDVFIKCKDEYGNLPIPEGNNYICTSIIRGSDF